MTAENLITGNVVSLHPGDTGAFALARMEELRLSHLPVTEGPELAGIISEKAIMGAEDPDLPIGMYPDRFERLFVNPAQPLFEVLRLFTLHRLTMLPVAAEDGRYMGDILLPAVTDRVAQLAGVHLPGGIITLEVSERDFSLPGIVGIVESNDARILSCLVTHMAADAKYLVTLKLSRVSIGPLLQAFFRHNYHVTGSWSDENTYQEGLRERFDALMNYLSI